MCAECAADPRRWTGNADVVMTRALRVASSGARPCAELELAATRNGAARSVPLRHLRQASFPAHKLGRGHSFRLLEAGAEARALPARLR